MGTIRVVASRPSTEAGMTRSIQQVAGFGKSHPQPATNSFDVDRVVRQGFTYSVLSAIVVGTYAVVLLVAAVLVPDQAARLQVPLGLSACGEGSRGAGCPTSSALSPGTTPCP